MEAGVMQGLQGLRFRIPLYIFGMSSLLRESLFLCGVTGINFARGVSWLRARVMSTQCSPEFGTCEPLSKPLVYPLVTPIVVPYMIPYITPFMEFRLWLMGLSLVLPRQAETIILNLTGSFWVLT